jgi:methylenetetrahydrofolate dehydrogenase (NADP+)/methenyltetrahydrofolate cyclohydrolase
MLALLILAISDTLLMNMKLLDGRELAGYIKERQAKAVRFLRQSGGVQVKLAIIVESDNPVIETYIKLKSRYGDDIGAIVEIHRPSLNKIEAVIEQLNEDKTVHGIIVQLPLSQPDKTNEILNKVSPAKDVDGLGEKTKFDPATPTAILWLLSGYNIELVGKQIALVGEGRLVGSPLSKMLGESGLNVKTYDDKVKDLKAELLEADVIITATGQPDLIKSDMVKNGAVVVDAGTTSEGGEIRGDADDSLYERDDVTITPRRGGVGPLTIAALFEHVLQASRDQGVIL